MGGSYAYIFSLYLIHWFHTHFHSFHFFSYSTISLAIHVLAQIFFNHMMPPPHSLSYTLGRSDKNNHSYDIGVGDKQTNRQCIVS